jgi:alanyl-tRNA synthetase
VEEDNIVNIAKLLNTSKSEVYNRIIKLYYDYELLEKTNEELRSKLNSFESERLIKSFKTGMAAAGRFKYLISKFGNVSGEELKELVNALSSRRDFPEGDSVVVLISNIKDEKLIYIVSAKGSIDASAVIKRINSKTGGKGGGKKDFSQGGTQDVSKFDEIEKIVESVLL